MSKFPFLMGTDPKKMIQNQHPRIIMIQTQKIYHIHHKRLQGLERKEPHGGF